MPDLEQSASVGIVWAPETVELSTAPFSASVWVQLALGSHLDRSVKDFWEQSREGFLKFSPDFLNFYIILEHS